MAKQATSRKNDDDDTVVEERKPDESDKKGLSWDRQRDEDERKDRARLRKEHELITPEKLSELMTEKSVLKREHEAEIRRLNEEHQHRIHELDIQIARGQPYNPGKTV